jgi:hypothetical protein
MSHSENAIENAYAGRDLWWLCGAFFSTPIVSAHAQESNRKCNPPLDQFLIHVFGQLCQP